MKALGQKSSVLGSFLLNISKKKVILTLEGQKSSVLGRL